MNENMTIEMERDQESGQITYANEVIATIVSVATGEVEGISGIAGTTSALSGRIAKGKIPRGVRVDVNNGDVSVDVSVTVDYGMPIQKVGRNAQENVRKSIESMTGLHVDKVDLHVVGVSFEKENQELQQSQKIADMRIDTDDAEKDENVVVELVEEETVVPALDDDAADDEE
ncbi:MAG: Asp23/Gls24 family envelope stress response protein [Clostridia bacterium]|nr:Asp23/Gls24 family envelope stress response protein [Clostridia bacterium]